MDELINILGVRMEPGGPFVPIPALKGLPGDDGDDGVSPSVTVEEITGGHRITITDAAYPEGQHFDVMDGSNDAGRISYDPEEAYESGTIGAAANALAADKVDKETGKGLSTEDYTSAEKTKLAGIAAGAEVNVQSDWNQSDSTADDYIKNKPTIPDELADLSDDSTHRLVTDTEKTAWNGKVDKAAQATKTADMTQPVGIDGDGKLWAKGGGTAEDITYDPEETYSDGTVGKELSTQSATIANLKSSDIQFAHDHMGIYRDADGDLCEL